jgi:hypothetical protein
MTTVSPYCQIHGYDFSSIVYAEGVEPSGGALDVEEIPIPSRDYADIKNMGRKPKKYKIRARSTDRDEIETFLDEVNNAPEDAEFYPFDAERFGLIASAYAAIRAPKMWGTGKNFYEADAEIVCREAWLYGPDQGIDFQWTVPLNAVSETLTNNGHMVAPINYLQCGGDRIAEYVEDLSVRITPGDSSAEHDRELVLCDKLLRGDIFQLGWRGEVLHSYDAPLTSLSGLDQDVHGLTSGGAVASGVLTLDDADYVMIPFYGPLPASGEPKGAKIELIVDALTGDGADVYRAFKADLSDIAKVDHDELVVGENTIYIPEVEGKGLVAIGVKAAASGSVNISALKGTVKRYVAKSQIPYIDVGESCKIRVEATAGQRLRFLQACIPDRFWY